MDYGPYWYLLAQPFEQFDHGQKQGDDDGADDEAEDHDHEGLEQADQALDQDVDFLVVDIGDFVEHGVQIAGLLANVDHVDDHVVDEAAFLQGLGDGVALPDRLVDALIAALEDDVGTRLPDDAQSLQ